MSLKIALLFPGQGAQYVGMGKEVASSFPDAASLFEKADKALGFSLSKLCFEGPEDQLNLTINSQPAIFTTSLAIWEVLKNQYRDLKPAAVCGLSLGEFSALTAAGSLSFDEGLQLVRKRGAWMHEAGTANPGSMCSVIGLAEELCDAVAKEAGVQVANYNSPEQIVLSGTSEGIEKAMVLAKEKGAKKVIPLKVSGAFHSKLMQAAQAKLQEELKKTRLNAPQASFIPNVTAELVSNTEEIRKLLGLQVTSSVKWTHTMKKLREQGIKHAIELGPGKVLKGLAKRTLDDFSVQGAETPEEIQTVQSFLRQEAFS